MLAALLTILATCLRLRAVALAILHLVGLGSRHVEGDSCAGERADIVKSVPRVQAQGARGPHGRRYVVSKVEGNTSGFRAVLELFVNADPPQVAQLALDANVRAVGTWIANNVDSWTRPSRRPRSIRSSPSAWSSARTIHARGQQPHRHPRCSRTPCHRRAQQAQRISAPAIRSERNGTQQAAEASLM